VNIQVFGTKKCQDTRKAERHFKERGISFHYVDLTVRGLSIGKWVHKAGGMLMFHGNLVHGSAGNITPYPRKIVYLTLNAVSNYIRTPTRPEYIAHRDFTPIQTVDDDALLRLARAHRQAAE
jgi:ectoine hydroxylase-related dioxygenase (phytanoyl-CoA dioxygenase family)